MSGQTGDPLVEVRNLKKHYPIERGILREEVGRVRAVDGISFEIDRGETLGLVGESGCGKSTAATSMLRLEEPTEGKVIVNGEDVTNYNDRELKRFRRKAQMIFQDPDSSFDPRMSIGESVAEPLRIHGLSDTQKRRNIVKDLLERVGMSADDIDRYPHEFSGGQKQRIALARALTVNPEVVIADEPASALDVSIQADILGLLRELQEEYGLAILFISHDLGVIRDICDKVAVMYLGEIVEKGETETLFRDPQHPYTRALLGSIPNPDPRQRGQEVRLSGDVPTPSNPPSGCRFHTRCPEIIQPEGYEFDQEHWRSVMDLRVRVGQRSIDPESQREYVVAETSVESTEDVTEEQIAYSLRDEFGIPSQLGDPRADEVIAEAIDLVVDNELEQADQLLSEEFSTVCERERTDLVPTDVDQEAACHLHDEQESPQYDSQQVSSDD
jgi:peptide/nickel transport system ATP-binding protein